MHGGGGGGGGGGIMTTGDAMGEGRVQKGVQN